MPIYITRETTYIHQVLYGDQSRTPGQKQQKDKPLRIRGKLMINLNRQYWQKV